MNQINKNRCICSPKDVISAWEADLLPNSSIKDWDSIDWKSVNSDIISRRRAIYDATQKGELATCRKLQSKLIFNKNNLLLAVRRVTQINKGRNTAGIDQFIITGKDERIRLVDLIHEKVNIVNWEPSPAIRVYIPKKNGKLRPLGIPTVIDRVIQAVIKSALEPEWEAKADVGSYGFRPSRSCADALEKIHTTLNSKNFKAPKKQWVLDADIKGCFDNIDQSYLINKIGDFPVSNLLIRWLKAGYLDRNVFHHTDTGTPQGGIISPLLANIALDGLENQIGVNYRTRVSSTASSGFRLAFNDYISKGKKQLGTRMFVRYADDFVVLCDNQEDAILVRDQISFFLKERGLELSPEKTSIKRVEDGFDFLGCHIRSYKGNYKIKLDGIVDSVFGNKVLITPSKATILKYHSKLDLIFKACRGSSVDVLISKLNPVIRGWVNYYRPYSSRKAFEALDAYLYIKQTRFIRRMHANKSHKWLVDKYFGTLNLSIPNDKWVFGNKDKGIYMLKHRWFPITRHLMIPNGYSPDDPSKVDFYLKRGTASTISNLILAGDIRIAKSQRHVCPWCNISLYNNEVIEKHHLLPKSEKGKDSYANLVWLHKMCHQAVTSDSDNCKDFRNYFNHFKNRSEGFSTPMKRYINISIKKPDIVIKS